MNKKDIIQKEALEAIVPHKYCSAVLGTGSGKTLLGLKDMHRNYNETCFFLVVGPKKTIEAEWINNAKQHGYEYLIEHFKFTTYRSLHKQSLIYDRIYLDECHSLTFAHEEWLKEYTSRGGSILGLTGTFPIYNKSEKGIMCNKYCPKVYEYNVDDGVEDNMLNDYKIYVHMLELSSEKNIPTKKGTMSEVDSNKMWERNIEKNQNMMTKVMRMKAIQSYKTKLIYAKQLLEKQNNKTLIFATTTKQADYLCKHTVHSKNKKAKENLEMFKLGTINKLASVDQLSEGVTVPNLKTGIIMHAYSNERKLAQKLGRFLRLNPNDTCTIHLLCYKNTVDEKWCRQALQSFNKSKIFLWKNVT